MGMAITSVGTEIATSDNRENYSFMKKRPKLKRIIISIAAILGILLILVTIIYINLKSFTVKKMQSKTGQEVYLMGTFHKDHFDSLAGHSIVRQKNDRVYIEKGNQICLGNVSYFTFEPHISVKGSKYGYKRENIYYFENGVIKEL